MVPATVRVHIRRERLVPARDHRAHRAEQRGVEVVASPVGREAMRGRVIGPGAAQACIDEV